MARDPAKRDVRVDMSSCDEPTARRLLEEYTPLVQRMVGDFHGLDTDDLVAVGKIAVIEAHVTFRESRAIPRRSWTTTVIRWRMAVAVDRTLVLQRLETPLDDGDPITNGHHDPEKAFLREVLTELMGHLSPRHQAVLEGRLRGETMEEIGDMLGLGRSRVEQEEKAAWAVMRKLAEDGL